MCAVFIKEKINHLNYLTPSYIVLFLSRYYLTLLCAVFYQRKNQSPELSSPFIHSCVLIKKLPYPLSRKTPLDDLCGLQEHQQHGNRCKLSKLKKQ